MPYTSRMATVLYSCKHCKVGKRIEYPNRDQGRGSWWRDGGALGRVFPGHSICYGRGRGYNFGDGVCSECGRAMTWGYLQAWKRPEVPCDARCTNARGFKCDCSCGGEHHGSGWGSGMFTGLLLQAA